MPRFRALLLTGSLLLASLGLAAPAQATTCQINAGAAGEAVCDVFLTGLGAVDGVCAKATNQSHCFE